MGGFWAGVPVRLQFYVPETKCPLAPALTFWEGRLLSEYPCSLQVPSPACLVDEWAAGPLVIGYVCM